MSRTRIAFSVGAGASRSQKRSRLLSSVFWVLCSAFFILLLAPPSHAQTASAADFDASGVVDFADFLEFAAAFGSADTRFDLDASGRVDFPDFLSFITFFGQEAPDECGNALGNGDEIVDGPDGPEGADFDQAFRSLTVHPTDPLTVLVGTERNGFVKTTDGGRTWARSRYGLRHLGEAYPEIWDIAWDPVDTNRVYAATLDSPGPVTGDHPSSIGGVYRSADGGETWERANCGFPTSRVTSIQVLPSDPSVVIAGLEGGEASFTALLGEYFDGGLYRSADRGDTWSKVDIGESDTRNGYWRTAALADSLNGLITFGFNYNDLSENLGFLRSLDGGLTWESFGEDLRNKLVVGWAVSSDGRTIYANERDSFVIHVSRDGGATWTVTQSNQANGPIAVSPEDADLVLYAGRYRIYRSSDGLASVGQVLESEAGFSDIVFAPSDPTVVYAVTDGYLVYRSEDVGLSWELLANLREGVLNP